MASTGAWTTNGQPKALIGPVFWSLHGKAHSVTRRVPFLTLTGAKPFEVRGAEFVPVPVPPPLRAPRRPMYLERGKREPGKLLSRWNLVVPERILNRGWAEVT